VTAEPSPSPLNIILFAALPQEMAAFKARTGRWNRAARAPAPTWQQGRPDRSLLLVETGMGKQRLQPLFQWATNTQKCDLLVSFGFGGGLTPRLNVGELCLCSRFVRWNPELSSVDFPELKIDARQWEEALGSELHLHTCLDVTTPQMTSKRGLSACRPLQELSEGAGAIVDMESHILAELAQAASIPFVALRSVSDPLDHELDFDLSAIADHKGKVQIPKILAAVLGKPARIRSLVRLWRDSRMAGQSLGQGLAILTGLPRERLDIILRSSSVEIISDQPVSQSGSTQIQCSDDCGSDSMRV
jgi:adenosylhomocysteine nucleosidase